MDLKEVIKERRSIRNFTKQKVSKETINYLIEQAILAPSSMNSQPWAFFVIQNEEKLLEINRRTKKCLLETLNDHPKRSVYKERFESEEFNIFYGGTSLLVICSKPEMSNGVGDSHLAAQNVMLSAWDEGVGSCFLGFARTYMETAEAKAWLGIPEDYIVVAPIVLGYFDGVPTMPERKSAEILFWDEG